MVRWALLSAHYRQPLDWNQALLDQSRKALDRLYGALHRAAGVESNGDEPPEDFLRSIEDDINTPGAMATLFALSSEIERAMTAGDHGVVARAKGSSSRPGRFSACCRPIRQNGSRARSPTPCGSRSKVCWNSAPPPARPRTGPGRTGSATG